MPSFLRTKKIVFLTPPYKRMIQRKWRCSPARSGCVFPPLELLSLASVCPLRDDMEVVVIDAVAEKLGWEAVVRKLLKHDVKMIVFMPGFESFEEDLRVVSSIKGRLPEGAIVVCFGFLPGLYYEAVLNRFSFLDYVLVGEPEETFAELVPALLLHGTDVGGIEGVAFRDGSKVVYNGNRHQAVDVSRLPFPDRRLINNRLYADPFLSSPMTGVVTSRGCPHQCGFCVDPYGQPFRQRSAQSVVLELRQVVGLFNIHDVRFMDDNFTIDKERLLDICRGIVDEGLRLNWTCLSRADTFDRDMLEHMAKAGCKAIFIGVESGSQKVLDHYGKGYGVDQVKRQCRLVKESGIDLVAWFMIGSPVETCEDVADSLKLAFEIDADFVCLNEFRPMPTTPMFKALKGQITVSELPFSIRYDPLLSRRDIVRCRVWFYLKFYLSVRVLGKMVARCCAQPARAVFFVKEFFSVIRREYVEK